ncbi:hypothetical protein J2S94_004526 [Arthrobacter bambusae]|nr:hypothetical protein [Arthrobacter bambusae]
MAKPYFRVAFVFIGLGCALAVVLVLVVLGMDVLHLKGELEAMRRLSYVYDAAEVGAMGFLCVGLALPTAARRMERGKHMSDRVTPLSRSRWAYMVPATVPWRRTRSC